MPPRSMLLRSLLVLLAVSTSFAAPARGEWLLPLAAETAETVGDARAEVGLGASYSNDARFPAFTPKGDIKWQNLAAAPTIGFRIAPAEVVEIQASYEFLAIDENTVSGGKNSAYGGGDARLFTKIWASRERTWLPASGVRFGVKLPNASRDDNLGTDETDFLIQVLGSKRFGDWATHLNLGLAILGNPGFGSNAETGQDDLFTYDIALVSPFLGARAPDAWGVRGLLEVTGATGSRFDNDFAEVRGGPQVTYDGWTFYAGANGRIEGAAAQYGFSAGAFYTFGLEGFAALFD